MLIKQKKDRTALPGEEEKVSVPMIDLKIQYNSLRKEIENTLRDIMESGHFVLGAHVKELEKKVAEYHGVKYAVSLASGTDALHLCLRALDIKKGDEVITTPFTFIAAAEAIVYVGATPVFADIDEHTLNIDPSKIKEKITSKTRAIIPVHLFGYPADMEAIMDIAGENNLKVIEDCAQSFGAIYQDNAVGSIGDAGCFSFYPSKNLGAYGDGGMMITDNPEIYERVSLLRNHGSTESYRHGFIGYNSRLDEIQAAILNIKLKYIDTYNRKRRELAQQYSAVIKNAGGSIHCPLEKPGIVPVYHQYTIRSPGRAAIQKALKDNSISSVIYYPLPLHLQEAFKYLGYGENDFPASETASKEVVSLPMYPELEPETVRFIAEIVVKAVR